MPELTDFLLARFAEDEAWARSDSGRAGIYDLPRWIADLKAKRRIVELCTRKSKERPPPHGTLRLLASVYADHPDFRDEWRP